MSFDEELKYFAAHLDGRPVEIADARNALEVLEILEKATESIMGGQGDRSKEIWRYEDKSYYVHETAVIDQDCSIGIGTKIWHFSHVLSDTKIGENGNIGQNVAVGPGVTIGSGCKIQNNVSIYKGVHLEDDVFCGPSMVFTNVYNPRAAIRKMDELRPTRVKKGATIGSNATILCGMISDN